jgi:signal transduction histidine kinase
MVAIFERYFQATNTHDGKGIGLAIVKSYCDRYGIGIDIKSVKNLGTTVMLDLKAVCFVVSQKK